MAEYPGTLVADGHYSIDVVVNVDGGGITIDPKGQIEMNVLYTLRCPSCLLFEGAMILASQADDEEGSQS